jgi:hypothetical protein
LKDSLEVIFVGETLGISGALILLEGIDVALEALNAEFKTLAISFELIVLTHHLRAI